MSKIEAVLFDLDGTLIDTAPDFVVVINLLRGQHSLPPLDDSSIRSQVSNGARALITLAFGLTEGSPGFSSRLEELLDLYLANLASASSLFEGLDSVLSALEEAHIPWGIVTNKPRRFTVPLLQHLGLTDRCASIVCPDDVIQKKPHPEPILKACREINVDPRHTIYVGDHLRDIESGNSANNHTIAVSWGYIEEDDDPQQWKANHVVDTTAEFRALLINTYQLLN
ncbi:phosphoglycolate phosphatase [Gammaproteobacteria bacterium 45_16_T64]|nr:phosphoglycolate phosphatase [Gammaproteobacteria bacterium 45_16_T64]